MASVLSANLCQVQNLVDQHVRRLGSNAEHPRDQTYHRVRALVGGGRRQFAQPFLLNRADLLAQDA